MTMTMMRMVLEPRILAVGFRQKVREGFHDLRDPCRVAGKGQRGDVGLSPGNSIRVNY